MSGGGNRTSFFDPSSADAPQPSGERLVSVARLAMAFIAVPLLITYFSTSGAMLWEPLLLCSAAVFSWAAISGVCLALLARGMYRTWLSFLSVLADVGFATAIQIALLLVLPLNFINGPVTAFYFIMVGLAALRKSRRLVLLAGVGLAVVHLVLSAAWFYGTVPEGHLVLAVGSRAIDIRFVDEITVSALLAFVGWIGGHVTGELRLAERHYRDLFERAPDGILIVSQDSRVLAANSRFGEMLGAGARGPLEGRRVGELLELDERGIEAPFAPEDLLGSPTSLRRADGARTPVRTVAMSVEYEGAAAFAMSVRDVTEQVRLERQLAQSQKMEMIGRLASGLAHDFNNILGGILGVASLAEHLAGKLGPGPSRDRLARQLQVVRECGENARVVVSRLLTFSRSPEIETEPLDLNAVAGDVAAVCRTTFTGDIEIDVTGTPQALIARADATSLKQALLNLCINARDAMPGGGRLTIRVREVDERELSAKRHPGVDPGEEYCCIEVADTGVGMDELLLEKIFDPFFTTKPRGEGTGLGLSMVYSIARAHGGFVEVRSAPGQGSCFQMYLTRARESLLPDEPLDEPLPRGTGRVLVVDDDELLRSTVQGMLAELGYDVACAADGESALGALGEGEGGFDLVLLDIVMPGMGGVRALELMRERGVRAPVVVMSGFMNGASSARLDKQGVAAYMRKPFNFAGLARTVRAALDRKR